MQSPILLNSRVVCRINFYRNFNKNGEYLSEGQKVNENGSYLSPFILDLSIETLLSLN